MYEVELYDSDDKNLGFDSVKGCALAPTSRGSNCLGLKELNKSHPSRR
jgi:hypothetical protein